MPTLPVNIRIGAVDRLSKVLNRVTRNMGSLKRATKQVSDRFALMQMKTEGARKKLAKLGGSMKRIGSTMTSRMSAPIIAISAGVIKLAADFEASMNKVKALTKNLTDGEFEALRKKAIELGTTTQFSATQAADAMSFLSRAGRDANSILSETPEFLFLAAASATDLATTFDIASNIMGPFKIKSEDAARVANVLARAVSGSNVTLENLGETMKFAGPIAEKFGASLEDSAAAAGLLGNAGIQGTLAGTALKNAFLGLAAPTTKAAKKLQELGVTVTDRVTGKMLGFAAIMKNLGTELKDMPKAAKLQALNAIFGKIGLAGGALLADFAETGELQTFITRMSDTTITARKMAETMQKGAKGGVKAMFSAIEGLAIAIGDSGILEMFTDMVKGITEFVRDLTKSSPKIMKWTFIIGIVTAVLGPLLIAFGALIAIIPLVITGVTALSAALALPAGLIALIPVAIALVIAQGVLLVKHWEEVKEFGGRIWDAISIFLDSRIGQIMALMFPFVGIPLLIIKHWEPIKKFMSELWAGILETFGLNVEGFEERTVFFTGIVDDITTKFDALKNFFTNLWTSIKQAFFDKFPSAAKTIAGLLARIKSSMPSLPDIPSVPDGIIPDVKKIGDTLAGRTVLEPGTFGPLRPTTPTSAAPSTKNLVEIDFKNMPSGVLVKSPSRTPDFLTLNTGRQGVAQ